jgi:hypothetical protein
MVAGTYTWSASYSGDTNNSSTHDQGGTAEQTVVSPASPSLVTTASGAVTLGTTAPSLSDSAVLSGGFFETGSITFTLTGPGGFSYTQTDTVNGNGTYTAGTTAATFGQVAGTYTWSATYNGDGNNLMAQDQGGTAEQTVVSPASPSVVTTASGAVTLGTMAPSLSDSAVLSGGFAETGTITFTLTGPGGFSYTQTDTVNGNGTYTAGTTVATLGQVAGTYTWSATYNGDGNNLTAQDQGGTAEQTVVSPAHPHVLTTASPGSVTLGTSGATLSDSAVISGGFFETGTITFVLSGPGGFSFTQTDTVNGNGTYTASDALTAGAATGTYTWSVTYSGDGNNLTAPDQGGTAEQTAVSTIAPMMFRMTGGGSIFLPDGGVPGAGVRVTHGFELHCNIDANNHLEINWGGNHFHLVALTSVTCLDDPSINPAPPPFTSNLGNTMIGVGIGTFSGTFNGVKYQKATATVQFKFTDAGEPGTNDTASYVVTLSDGTVVLNTLGSINLTFGNHQVHAEIPSLSPAAASVEQQIAKTFGFLNTTNLTTPRLSSLTQDLITEFAALEAAIHGATISGQAFFDRNQDGIRELEESGIAGMVVQLFASNGTKVAQTKTDINGFYQFNVPAGRYYLVFVAPSIGYHFSSPFQGTDRDLSSTVNSSGRTSLFTALDDQLLEFLNAGLYI